MLVQLPTPLRMYDPGPRNGSVWICTGTRVDRRPILWPLLCTVAPTAVETLPHLNYTTALEMLVLVHNSVLFV